MTEKNRDERLSIVYQDEQGHVTLDMLRLADIFRRAGKDVFLEHELAVVFNSKAAALVHKLSDFEQSSRINNDLNKLMTEIAILAHDNEIKRVILPVGEKTIGGAHLRNNILYGENFSRHYNVQIDFQPGDYKPAPEVKKLGAPQETTTPNVFDYPLTPLA